MNKVIKILIEKVCGFFHIKLTDRQISSFSQFIMFGIIGVTNTLISYLLYIGVLIVLAPMKLSWDYIAGNVVAFMLSVLWSFYWNNKYVFALEENKKRNIAKALLKTYAAYGLTGIVLNNILSVLFIRVLGISKYIAPLFNIVISVPINFLINKLWAFKAEDNKNLQN